MGRCYKISRVKKNQAYTVDELAFALAVSSQTVRAWIKAGMSVLDDSRPTMVMGFQAIEYLDARTAKAKRPMAIDQFYCFRCRSRQRPYGMMVDYLPTSATGGRLTGICEVCECALNRNTSLIQLPDFRRVFDIEIKRNGHA